MTEKLLNILVFDDMREFKSESPYIKHANLQYCKSTEEFEQFWDTFEEPLGDHEVWPHVLILDHDLGGTDTARKGAEKYAEKIDRIAFEDRPTVVIVTANPVGQEYFFKLFYDICPDVWKDPFGYKIGLKSG